MVEDLTFCFLALQIILSLCVFFSFQGFTPKSVLITMRIHLFPFRTQKLSSFVPKILGGQPPGKIGRCRHSAVPFRAALLSYSSLAQLAEHAAVNRRGVRSSRTSGASKNLENTTFSRFFTFRKVSVKLPFWDWSLKFYIKFSHMTVNLKTHNKRIYWSV